MLSRNDSISHYTPGNITIWMTMSLQAGLVNMGGFMACHQFVSHVTGYATLFGVEIRNSRYDHALSLLAVPFFFLMGAILSGLLVDHQLRLKKKPRYYISFGFIFTLLLFVWIQGTDGYFGDFGVFKGDNHSYVLLAILCLVSGIQNGTVTSVSRSVIRTTHLTGVATDLGIGIVRSLNRKAIPENAGDETKANFMRVGIIFFFGLGSIIGAFVFSEWQYMGFCAPLVTSGMLFVWALYAQLLPPLNGPGLRVK